MNPPTTGHQKLIDKLHTVARKLRADVKLYLSHSSNPDKDPLSYKDKIKLAQAAWGRKIVAQSSAKTIIQVLQDLEKTYDEATLVVGSDRVADFDTFLNKYNGRDYSFDSLKVQSAGERDPDAADVSGMSASKMRGFAIDNDFNSFRRGLPPTLGQGIGARKIFKAVQKGMGLPGIKEELQERDYKKERANYHSRPEQMEKNRARKRARYDLEKKGKVKRGDGLDVHHKDGNALNNDKKNLSVVTQHYNRREPRLRDDPAVPNNMPVTAAEPAAEAISFQKFNKAQGKRSFGKPKTKASFTVAQDNHAKFPFKVMQGDKMVVRLKDKKTAKANAKALESERKRGFEQKDGMKAPEPKEKDKEMSRRLTKAQAERLLKIKENKMKNIQEAAFPVNQWWKHTPDELLSTVYHSKRQLPPADKAKRAKNLANIVKQLNKMHPAPSKDLKKFSMNMKEEEMMENINEKKDTVAIRNKAEDKMFGRLKDRGARSTIKTQHSQQKQDVKSFDKFAKMAADRGINGARLDLSKGPQEKETFRQFADRMKKHGVLSDAEIGSVIKKFRKSTTKAIR
tara:strand:- start:465 stop:2168 length:1704 start_codon:yes stop_codon:yes gene_type:complete